MKSALLMLLVLSALAACTAQPPQETNGGAPGDDRSFNPITVEQTSDLKLNILNVCGALEEKERVLEDYVGEAMQVTYQESDCEGKLGNPVNQIVRVTKDSGHYIFQNDARTFPSSEIETLNSGVMKEICGHLTLLQNPMRASATSQIAIEFRQMDTSYCRTDSQNVCLLVMKGRISADEITFSVSESTVISFHTTRGGKTGFYNYKNVKSYGTCGTGKYKTKVITFN
jgi:hypothetical protein